MAEKIKHKIQELMERLEETGAHGRKAVSSIIHTRKSTASLDNARYKAWRGYYFRCPF